MAPASKRRKVATSRIERPRGVAEQFRQADVSDVKEVSKMFEGKEFCVVNAPRELSKQEMERKIAEVNQNDSLSLSLFLSVYCTMLCKCVIIKFFNSMVVHLCKILDPILFVFW